MARGDYLAKTKGGTVTPYSTGNVTPRPGGGSGNSMIGGLINSGIGLLENNYNQNLANTNVNNEQGIFDQQIAAARPGSTAGSIYGDSTFDPATNTLNYSPSGALQGMTGSMFAQQQGLADQLTNFNKDPMALGQYIGSLTRPQEQLAEEQALAKLQEQLNAKGMFSSSYGGQMQGELAQAQLNAANTKKANDIMLGQNIASGLNTQQTNVANSLNAINTGQLNNFAQNTNMGVDVAAPQGLTDAYTNQMATNQKQGSGIADILGVAGTALAGPIGGLFGNIAGQFFG